ncbi:MAG TPA: ATP-dependent zinc metalloprotease FtsH [Nordella sp.]|nr:ATP-dependent zinc metalloprotease FtsH [Nordella sp.]
MDKKQQFNMWYVALAFAGILLAQGWWQTYRTVEPLDYSDFLALLKKGEITEVAVSQNTIEGKFKTPQNGKEYFTTTRVDPAIANDLTQYNVKFSGQVSNGFLATLLSWIVPVLFFFALYMFFFRRVIDKQGLGGMMNVGKSKAKVYVEKDTGVTFADVAGVDEAEAELVEIVSFLKDKEKYERLGATIPRGILLVGPPGTGKTLIARAVAGEAKVPFFSISGSEFVEMFVGVGAARVRDLFEQARKTAPCIIFIDELDALGKARSGPNFGGNDEKEQTLNQLLTELDGFDPREGIVLLAATNRPEILDPALLRAGRFDRQVVVDRPDKSGRVEILKVHMKKIKADKDVDLEHLAQLTTGFAGADLANLINEAAIFATRRGAKSVTMKDFVEAFERIVAGSEKKSRVLNPQDKKRVAYHEMGHALAAASLPGVDPVQKISIIPRSIGSLGYTMQRPTEDKFLITLQELKNRMVVLMAGRAAEELIFKEISTGAADDITRATDIARQIVTRFGMAKDLGQAVFERQSTSYIGDNVLGVRQKDYSDETAQKIDLAVKKLIDEAYARAKKILTTRHKDLEAGTQILLEKESITPEDFKALLPKAEKAAAE